ncbi:hypothetical protein QBC32DRAFT_214366, partial [Pseudoneurospora amorphoporcata]
TPSHNMIDVDEIHSQHHLLSKSASISLRYSASTGLHAMQKSLPANVVIPTNDIQLRTVYITTLGTNGANCTRKPERLLPERARWTIPPMVVRQIIVNANKLGKPRIAAFLGKEKGCPTEERPATSRSGLGVQSGEFGWRAQRGKAHN